MYTMAVLNSLYEILFINFVMINVYTNNQSLIPQTQYDLDK